MVEGFKKLRMTNSTMVILVKNEGDTVEVSPERKPPPGPRMTKKSLKESPTKGKEVVVGGGEKKTRVKGIDSMTVEELKAALKKRKLKGLGGMRK